MIASLSGRRRAAARCAGAVAVAWMLAGCGGAARTLAPEPVGASPADGTAGGAVADTSAVPSGGAASPVPPAPPAKPEAKPETKPEAKADAKGAEAKPPEKPSGTASPGAPETATPSEPAPAITPDQKVGVDLDASTKAGLAAQAARDLEEAERTIRGIARDSLSAERREKLETVESLIQASRAAAADDAEAAASLAHKARLLAAELAGG